MVVAVLWWTVEFLDGQCWGSFGNSAGMSSDGQSWGPLLDDSGCLLGDNTEGLLMDSAGDPRGDSARVSSHTFPFLSGDNVRLCLYFI